MDYSKYPDNWLTEIRPAILERANHRCEWCGVENHTTVWRHPHEDCYHIWTHDKQEGERWYGVDRVESAAIQIMLTIAHVHDPDPMNADPANLAALCQACHNRHDIAMRHMNIIRRRNKELEDAGQKRLPGF
jgi:5-methylcytosine-specific restriction endonuclease McrA